MLSRCTVRRLAAVLTVALGCTFLTAADSAAPKKIATIEGITEYQLDNGLRVLCFPDSSRPTVTVNMTVLVGSRHEGYGETGMAHLLEHMVFKGTPTHPHVPKALQEHGAQFNGTTNFDRTNYFETMPATDANLEFGIHLEADRLVNSYVKREDLISEMTVVRNEFERGENSPDAVLNQRIWAAAYEWHNYGKSTIGNRSDIERVPIENLQAFYKKYYQPDNAVLVVAGKFDESKAIGLVQKHFGAIPRPERKLDTTYTEEPAQDGERLVTLRRVGDGGVVGVAYHVPAGPHPDFPAVQVLANILTTQPSGRLYKALVETKKAATVNGSAQPLHDAGLFEVTAHVAQGQSLDDVRNTTLKLVETFAAEGPTPEELNRARQQLLNQRRLDRAETSQLAIGLSNWAAQGDWRLYFLNRDRIGGVTADDVRNVAAKYLQPSNRTVGLFVPTQKPERVAIPNTPDLQQLVGNYQGRETVVAGEEFSYSPANIAARTQSSTLPDGIKVAMLPKKTRGQAVYAHLTIRYGNEENLRDLTTAAGFLGQLMMHGTKKLSRQQLQDELDKLQARLSSGGMMGGGGRRGGFGGGLGGGYGAVSFDIQAKRDTLPAVLELLQQVLREPALSAEEFEVIKRQRLAMLERVKSEPMMLAMQALQRTLSPYPKSDIRYVPTTEEQIQRLQAATVDQVRQLYQEYLGAQAGEFVVVGDFDPAAITKIVTEMTAGWKAAKPYARIANPVVADAPGGKQTINTPDKANANFLAGIMLPMQDSDADYPALLMANYIFGGGSLSSRLGDRIRQKEGYSYNVGSSFGADPFDRRASLTVTAICNPTNIEKVERAVREEVEKLRRDGVTGEELANAKQGYLQALQVRRSSDAGLVGTLGSMLYRGRTMAYEAELEQKIEALTATQVSEAFRKYFDPQKVVIVTAGDFKAANSSGGR